jgi:hypothetical protein
MAHGGKRKGAGRPRTDSLRLRITFTFAPETINLLQESVPPFKRSVFVESLIQAALPRVRCDDKEGRQRKSSAEWTDLNRSKRPTPRPAFSRAVPR